MSIGKTKLIAVPGAELDGDSVVSYLRDAAGVAITSTGGFLDVQIQNASLAVTATNLDIRDLVAATDSVSAHLKDGSGNAISSSSGSLNVNITNASLPVDVSVTTGSDKAEDSASVSGDIGTFILGVRNDADAALTSADGDYSGIAVDSAGRVKVTGSISITGVYAEDAAHTSGDIGMSILAVRQDVLSSLVSANGDYANLKVDGLGRQWINDAHDSGLLQTGKTVSTTAVAVVAASLSNRRAILVQNNANKDVYLGSSSVTVSGATKGIKIGAGASLELKLGPTQALFAIVASGISGSENVSVLEVA